MLGIKHLFTYIHKYEHILPYFVLTSIAFSSSKTGREDKY